MQIKTLGLTAILLAGWASNADADPQRPNYYRYLHCQSCTRAVKVNYQWQQRHETRHRKVHVRNRTEFVRWERRFTGTQKRFSHYQLKWVLDDQSGRGYAYRVWRKMRVPVYRTVNCYKNIQITRQVPVYETRSYTVTRWVRATIRTPYYICYR